MKKISLVALFAALVMSVNATDIWTGSKHVSWSDGGVQIAADQFAAAQPGNLIKVHFSDATDGIEFKVDTTDEFLSKGSGNYVRFTYPTTGIWSDIVRLKGSIVDGKFTLKNQNPILMTRNLTSYPYDELWASGSDLYLMFDGQAHFYRGYILTNGTKNLH